MMLSLYRGLTTLGGPVISQYLKNRMKRGKEDAVRFSERLGIAGAGRPDGPLVWLHGASVGESLSLLCLIDRLRQDHPGINLLVTTGTVTSAGLMEKRLPDGAFHQYVPVDRQAWVRRFLDHWKPDLVLWAESDFWPNLISEIGDRDISLVLVNGRISPRSYKGWQRQRGFIAKLLNNYDLCMAQTEKDKRHLVSLGAPNVVTAGNLKYAAAPLPVDEKMLVNMKLVIGDRPCWVAASTHEGEEEILAQTHHAIKKEKPSVLSFIIPRAPARGGEVADIVKKAGLSVALRSANEPITPSTDIYVADTVGELGLFYRLSTIAFIGKSLVDEGGQNPLEAAKIGSAVLYGPFMTNFEEMVERMADKNASIEVMDGDDLARTVLRLMDDEKAREEKIRAAQDFANAEAHVVDHVMDLLDPYLKKVLGQKTGGPHGRT